MPVIFARHRPNHASIPTTESSQEPIMNTLMTYHSTKPLYPRTPIMKRFCHRFALMLLALAPASAFAANSLGVNVTVTITASNAVEWTNADATPDVVGQRQWTITGAAVNTAYLSTTDGTITGPSSAAIATQATALYFVNRGAITITSSVTVANGDQWNFGGAPGSDTFMLEAYTDGGTTPIVTKVSGSALNLSTTQAKDATVNFALRITTPTTLSSSSKLTSSQVVTILATQN
jgi:hypothetical protein